MEQSKKSLLNIKQIKIGALDLDQNLISINTVIDENDIFQKIEPEVPVNEIIESIKLAQLESKHCLQIIKSKPEKYQSIDNFVFKITNLGSFIYCPPHFVFNLLSKIHRHESAQKLSQKLNSLRIWLPNKYSAVATFVGQCNSCDPSRSKRLHDVRNHTIAYPKNPFQTICIDLMHFGLQTHVLVCVDNFSHFIIAKVLKNSNARSIRDALLEIFTSFGLPQVLLSDNAKNLNAEILTRLYTCLGINHRCSTPYNSRGNSLCELAIRRLQEQTRIYQPTEETLKNYLNVLTFKLNTEIRPGNKYSSFQKLFHREMSWIRQIPDLSKTKKMTLNEDLRRLYNDAEEIRNNVLREITNKRSAKKIDGNFKSFSKNGDLMRIKKLPRVNEKKKTFHPFSDEIYEVRKLNKFTNTALLREKNDDKTIQPKFVKMHVRFLSRLRQGQFQNKDDVILMKMNELKTKSADELTKDYNANTEKVKSERKRTGNELLQNNGRCHQMRLRNRK